MPTPNETSAPPLQGSGTPWKKEQKEWKTQRLWGARPWDLQRWCRWFSHEATAALCTGLGLQVFHHGWQKRPWGFIPLRGSIFSCWCLGEGEFIFYSSVITEKLPALQQITSCLHQARNTEATQREGIKGRGRLGRRGPQREREGRKEITGLKCYNQLNKCMKCSNKKKPILTEKERK